MAAVSAPGAAGQVAPTSPIGDIVPIPVVHATTLPVSFGHHVRILVRSLEVTGLTAGFRVTCNGCRRRPGPVRRLTPAKGTVVFAGVDWLLVPGHDIAVRTYRPRAIGRYELLAPTAARGSGLVIKGSGCLRSLTRRTPCPPGVGTPVTGAPVAPTPPATPAPAPGPTSPTTTISSGPSGTVAVLPVVFTYSTDSPSATFECRLDGGTWALCPTAGISYGAITAGAHAFQVRAVAGGLVDPAPPQRAWTQAASAAPPPPPGTPPPAPPPPPTMLGAAIASPATIAPGQYMTSASGQYQLIMQGDGNLVLYTQGRALWSSGTGGHPGAGTVLQADGNLVVYGPAGAVLWSAGSEGHPGARLVLQDDGNIVVYASNSSAAWATGTYTDAMTPGARLVAGQYLRSANGAYQLIMQGDGNFVLYTQGRALWSTGTGGQAGASVTMQGDGNLVVYSAGGGALWDAHTSGHAGSFLNLQNDGNVVVYSPSRQALFNTHT